jgi:DNA-binding MarR family transcriptional regulator
MTGASTGQTTPRPHEATDQATAGARHEAPAGTADDASDLGDASAPSRGGTPPSSEDVRWLDPSEQQAWRNWISGTTVLFRALERELTQGFDITLDDYALLVLLSESDRRAARMSALADEAIVPRPQVTYRISRLEKRGYVERRPCPDDARGTEAHLTDDGFRLLEAAARLHVTNVREMFLDHLGDDEFALLGEAMGRVHAIIARSEARRA